MSKEKLKQLSVDRKLSNETFDKEKIRLEKLIAEDEVTYSVGDRFASRLSGNVMMAMAGNKVGIIQLNNGQRYGRRPITVRDANRITQKEFLSMGYCFDTHLTRTYDARLKKDIGGEEDLEEFRRPSGYSTGSNYHVYINNRNLVCMDISNSDGTRCLIFRDGEIDWFTKELSKVEATAKRKAK